MSSTQGREHLVAGAPTSATTESGRRVRLRVPALVAPYVGIVVGAIVLARIPETDFERFWWFAPAAVLAYIGVLSLTVGSQVRRREVDRARRERFAQLQMQLRSSLDGSASERRALLKRLLPRLREVQVACRSLPLPQQAKLREALTELDVRAAVESELKRSHRKWRRADALFALGWLADERSISVLQEALDGPDSDLAYVAGQALAEYNSAAACRCLVAGLSQGSLSRPLAATLLEGSRFPEASHLVAEARFDPDPQVRSWVCYLLGHSEDPRTSEWLLPLVRDPEADVRASAAEALSCHPDPDLLSVLLEDGHWNVRANAAKAVGDALLTELDHKLTPLLRDRVWWVRQSAALALGQLGRSSVAVLRPMLHDDDRFARNKAAEVLVEVGYVAEQIAQLARGGAEGDSATTSLAAVVRAEATSTIEASAGTQDAVTRSRLRILLDDSTLHAES